MKKIIRLTERDLTRIVRRVIREQDEVGEGFLSNLFGGGKKKDEKTTSNSNYGFQKIVDGNKVDKIYICEEFSGNKNKYYTHDSGPNEINIAFVSPSYANQNGLNTSGYACNSSEAGY
jgi:hypothetical protein